MSWQRKTIEDYYGAKLTAEPVGASLGPMVDLEWDADEEGADFFRLTREQAIELAKQLVDAAEFIG